MKRNVLVSSNILIFIVIGIAVIIFILSLKSSLTKISDTYQNKIAVIMHVGNINIFREIVHDYPKFFTRFDLFISCNTTEDKESILSQFPNAHVTVYENRGMDIGPFLKTIKIIPTDYDYYIKIHTKSDKKWRDTLLKNIDIDFFLTKENSNEIELYGAKEKLVGGMVNPCDFTYIHDIINRNYSTIPFDCKKKMCFIAGTIFVCNKAYIKELKKIKDIDYEYSILETGYVTQTKEDFKKTHSWEYFLGYIVYLHNTKIIEL